MEEVLKVRVEDGQMVVENKRRDANVVRKQRVHETSRGRVVVEDWRFGGNLGRQSERRRMMKVTVHKYCVEDAVVDQ